MAEQTTPAVEPAIEPTHQDYIDAIQELKSTTVSKDRYDAIVQERNALIKTLSNGGTIEGQSIPTKRTAAEIRSDIFGNGRKPLTPNEYVELSLELREAVLEEDGEDIFVAKGHHVAPTAEDYATSEKVATIYRECLDYANGDSAAFIGELQRRMVDTPMANITKYRR